ncbi:molecular chaperone DnaJ [Acinetobacter sp. 1207_04]|uniref:molecular chaperone DnaJ n=1 Tax=Acinetobacter sp. 1207_04 TaxID=2604449 RepID=UPI0040592174
MSFDLKISLLPDVALASPQHKKLQRLIEQIEQQKLDLAMWQNMQHEIQSYMHHKLFPIYTELHGTLFSQLEQLWIYLQQQDFSKADLEQLDAKLQSLAKTLKKSQSLNTEKINLVDEIYNFYQQDRTYSQSKKQSKQQKKSSKPSSQNINHFEQDECESVDLEIEYTEFEDWNTKEYEQQREEYQRKRLAQKREQAEKLAEQSLKTVYLKITAMIHPDREPDEAKKVEKTELLQVVNEAYAQQDLFYLLKMQLQLETNKGLNPKALSDEHLKFYKMALEAQSQRLASQIDDITDAFHWSEKPKPKNMQVKDVYKVIDADVVTLKEQVKWERERLKYIGKVKGLEVLLGNEML